MAQALLVTVDIPMGAEILRALDEAGLNVKVAAWMVLPEYEDWRIVLASPTFDKAGGRKTIRLIREALEAAEFPIERKPATPVLPMKDPTIRELRRIFGKAKSVEGMRIGGQSSAAASSKTATLIGFRSSLSPFTLRGRFPATGLEWKKWHTI